MIAHGIKLNWTFYRTNSCLNIWDLLYKHKFYNINLLQCGWVHLKMQVWQSRWGKDTCGQFHQHFTSAKNKVKLSVFFALLGYACIKAVRKMLVKLTPGWSVSTLPLFVVLHAGQAVGAPHRVEPTLQGGWTVWPTSAQRRFCDN